MNYEHISSEAVGEGHPDKVADYISDSILDACLQEDPNAHVACETLVKNNCVVSGVALWFLFLTSACHACDYGDM